MVPSPFISACNKYQTWITKITLWGLGYVINSTPQLLEDNAMCLNSQKGNIQTRFCEEEQNKIFHSQ